MKAQEFRPSPGMQIYAYKRAIAGESATDKSIAASIGLAAETVSRWKNVEGFSEWLESQLIFHRAPILEQLEAIARAGLAKGDFRYWEALAERYQFYTPEFLRDL